MLKNCYIRKFTDFIKILNKIFVNKYLINN